MKETLERRKYRREWGRKNREKESGYSQKWARANPEKATANAYAYRNRNPWMKSHAAARQRCNNSNHSYWKNYGGRGIKYFLSVKEIKELWFRDCAFMMKRPSLDRINNDGHYEFSNCRFIEVSDNVRRKYK